EINFKLGTQLKTEYVGWGGDFNKFSEWLENNPVDAAFISLPDSLHYPFATSLLNHGIHCLIVKPFTSTLEEARKLTQLQRKKNVHGAVEFHKRFDESNLYAKKILAEKRIGKPLYFTIDF